MAQIILYGNINHYAYVCVQDELHRMIRYRQVFVHDNHLIAMANDSPTSPEGNNVELAIRIHVMLVRFTKKCYFLLHTSICIFYEYRHLYGL